MDIAKFFKCILGNPLRQPESRLLVDIYVFEIHYSMSICYILRFPAVVKDILFAMRHKTFH